MFFDPARTRVGIVTCGGLCPGINSVIRSLYLELDFNYGVKEVLGLRHGYRGLNPISGLPPLVLTRSFVSEIHEEGGTMLGTSRGPQDVGMMVDFLEQQKIDVLFCIGGDGTHRGAHAICDEIRRRARPIAVVGIPKTIDNDIDYCDWTFGYLTAVDVARNVIHLAHTEARSTARGSRAGEAHGPLFRFHRLHGDAGQPGSKLRLDSRVAVCPSWRDRLPGRPRTTARRP